MDHAGADIILRKGLNRRVVLAGSLAAASALVRSSSNAEAKTRREALVDRLLHPMSTEQRVAQMFIFQAMGTGMSGQFESHLTSVRPGGIIFVAPNIGNASNVANFVTSIHGTNHKIPPFIAIDQEGGDVIRLPGDPAPGAPQLGLLSDKDVRTKSKNRAEFLSGFGFDVNFAPVADIAYQANSSMFLRSFGNDPVLVADKVSSVVRGARS